MSNTLKFQIDDLPTLLAAIETLNEKLDQYATAQQKGVWLTDAEVMDRLGISKSLLRDWRDLYELPHYQLGENRRYKAEEVDAWFSMFTKGNTKAMQLVNNGLLKKAQKVA